MFGTVSIATGHEHWQKEPSELEPIVGPLCRMIEELPKPALKALEKRLNPIMLIGGCAVVVGPDCVAEYKIRKMELEIRRANRQEEADTPRTGPWPPRFVQPARPAAARPDGPLAANEGPSPNGAGPWGVTLPPTDLHVDYE